MADGRPRITADDKEQLFEALRFVDRLYSEIIPWLEHNGEAQVMMLLDDSHRSLQAAGWCLMRSRTNGLARRTGP